LQSPPHILIVDDEEIVLVSLRDTLAREGYQVTTAAGALAALGCLKERPYSVIITDQQMPMLTGLELLSQARELQPHATRILITAVLNLTTVVDAINKGEVYRFIIKPWLREELLVTISNAIQRYGLVCRNQTLRATSLAMNEKLGKLNADLQVQVARVAEQKSELERLNLALEQNLHCSVELCLKTMQTFYLTLGNRARRVYELCRAMAEGLQLSSQERQTLEVSAWLHDIGLIGVSRQLIRQWEEAPASLTRAERDVIQQHPVLGEELAGFAHPLKNASTLIRAHHERFDGAGYPDGLKGPEIPWLGRLLNVAVFYAESSEDGAATVEKIKLESGRAFDPEAVRTFLRFLPQATVPQGPHILRPGHAMNSTIPWTDPSLVREVRLSELQPGMVVARGVYNANGLLLAPDGQRLTETFIDQLNNHNRITPLSQSLLVYS
jgi:response regulator RpfG family c-di-GMP phosphodiesterase